MDGAMSQIQIRRNEMKKIIVFVGLVGLVFLFLGTAEAATPARLFIGGYARMAHFSAYQGLGFGGEIGVHVSERLSLVAEGAIGTITLSSSYNSSYQTSQETLKLTMTPICLSMHLTAPLGDSFQPYVGAGVAYCSLKMTYSYSIKSTGPYAPPSTSESETRNFHAIAPVFKFGMAVLLAKNVRIIGECRQIVAKDRYTTTSTYSTSENDMFFGTIDLKLGIRILI
jgi:opacity protein-like surface antigen